MKTFLRVMKALSDPNRVRTLKLLENNPLCVCEIQEALGLAQPTVSSHMKILEDAGLVEKERMGTWMIYRQSNGRESVYAKTMLATIRDWLNEDPELRRMKTALPETTCQRALTMKSEP